jgi:hypothetical protein
MSNLMLLAGACLGSMCRADAIPTGSPPLMLHFIAQLNLLLRKQLHLQITDLRPECLIVEGGRAGAALGMLLHLTRFWRRPGR